MPVINGLEAIARIKQRIGNTFKTVIVTATAFEQEMEKFKTNDIDDVITKPFEYEDISGCLIKLLNTKFHTAAAEQEQITDDTPQKKDLTIPPKGIPASLNDKMKEAAEFSIITDIEELSDQIRQLGEEYQPLSDEINKLTKNFDMDAILELAKDLCHE
jgi:CheY-like chemotaxis protein